MIQVRFIITIEHTSKERSEGVKGKKYEILDSMVIVPRIGERISNGKRGSRIQSIEWVIGNPVPQIYLMDEECAYWGEWTFEKTCAIYEAMGFRQVTEN
jgi:hypothetical protein